MEATSYFKFQAFTTAVVHDERIRNRIKAAIAGNIKRGESEKDFYKAIHKTWKDAGFENPKQLQNMYSTNTALAFGAGQQAKMIAHQNDFPYWQYSAILDGRTRPSHKALHGKIFNANDHAFFPPIGFRCRCTAIPLTANQASKEDKNNFVNATDKEALSSKLNNAEFIGNKQQKFITWLQHYYLQKATPSAQLLIQKAIQELTKNNASLKEKVILLHEKKYNNYSTKEWKKIKFNKKTGAYIVEHNHHHFNKIGGIVERKVGEVLYNLGKQIEFLNENSKHSSPDIFFDKQTWDIKGVFSYSTRAIREAINNGAKANNVIFYFTKEVDLILLNDAYYMEKGRFIKVGKKMPSVFYISKQQQLIKIK